MEIKLTTLAVAIHQLSATPHPPPQKNYHFWATFLNMLNMLNISTFTFNFKL